MKMITIKTTHSASGETRNWELPAYVRRSGLAVHRVPEAIRSSSAWRISHTGTGLGIKASGTKKSLVELCRSIESLASLETIQAWCNSTEPSTSHPDLFTQIGKAVRRSRYPLTNNYEQ